MEEKRKRSNFFFYSSEPVEPITTSPECKKERAKIELTELATSLRNKLNSTGLPKWDITLEGYLEYSSEPVEPITTFAEFKKVVSGLAPDGGIAALETTLKLSQA